MSGTLAAAPARTIIPDPQNSSRSLTGFQSFRLGQEVQSGIRGAGFLEPRPIQVETIPAVLEGRDVLGLAQTGTGKTAAFVLPMLEKLLATRRPGPRALVVVPTRELALQIHEEIKLLARHTPIRAMTIFGGVSAAMQIRELRRRPDVLVACPGRLLDLWETGHVQLAGVETLVLDEADHMFDMGFLPDVRRILAALPPQRQNLLFSATMPGEIRSLATGLLKQPHVVDLAGAAPIETIAHALYPVAEARKLDLLSHLFGEKDFRSAIVFLRTKQRVKRLAERLDGMGHRAVALQGNMSQAQRDGAMSGFRNGRFAVLVATDLAARGIDVAGISHVVNFDMPNTPDAYTHRVGRTGRAEQTGKACTFVTGDDFKMVRAIEGNLGMKIPIRHVAGFGGAELVARSKPRSKPRLAAPRPPWRASRRR